jgi:hypothetical protein
MSEGLVTIPLPPPPASRGTFSLTHAAHSPALSQAPALRPIVILVVRVHRPVALLQVHRPVALVVQVHRPVAFDTSPEGNTLQCIPPSHMSVGGKGEGPEKHSPRAGDFFLYQGRCLDRAPQGEHFLGRVTPVSEGEFSPVHSPGQEKMRNTPQNDAWIHTPASASTPCDSTWQKLAP